MASVHTHRDLIAWQEALRLVKIVYRDTANFPSEETYGLKNQIRRAAVSVPSNIAEGARITTGELISFLALPGDRSRNWKLSSNWHFGWVSSAILLSPPTR